MTSTFDYKVRVTSEKEITPHLTGGEISAILKKYYTKGKCEVKLTGYSGSNPRNEVHILPKKD